MSGTLDTPALDALRARGLTAGRLLLPEVEREAEAADLRPDEQELLLEQLDERGVAVRDGTGRERARPATYANGDLAGAIALLELARAELTLASRLGRPPTSCATCATTR